MYSYNLIGGSLIAIFLVFLWMNTYHVPSDLPMIIEPEIYSIEEGDFDTQEGTSDTSDQFQDNDVTNDVTNDVINDTTITDTQVDTSYIDDSFENNDGINDTPTSDSSTITKPKKCSINDISYKFFQGKNSKKENIIQEKVLKNNIDGLKSWCSENPKCKGFNTDAYMKHTINPSLTTKSSWTNKSNKGIYIKQLPNNTIYYPKSVDYSSEEAQNIRTQMKEYIMYSKLLHSTTDSQDKQRYREQMNLLLININPAALDDFDDITYSASPSSINAATAASAVQWSADRALMSQFRKIHNKSCEGRNELGAWEDIDDVECARKCIDHGCRSFEYKPSSKLCQLSHTCTYDRPKTESGWDTYYRKSIEKQLSHLKTDKQKWREKDIDIENQSDLAKFRYLKGRICHDITAIEGHGRYSAPITDGVLECAQKCLEIDDCVSANFRPTYRVYSPYTK